MLKKTMFFALVTVMLVAAASTVWAGGGPDLKGMNITIGNWWADYDVNTFKPQNESDEKLLAWRTQIQKDFGFTIREKYIATWNEMPQKAAVSIMTGKPAAEVFVLQPNWAMALMRQDLIFPVSDAKKTVDLKKPAPAVKGALAPRWNQSTIDSLTFNGKIYGFSEGLNINNANVVFFNKRLFREAGLDPNLPYDMQKAGTWTWEAFFDLCKKLTRDINNDGITDTYALPRDLSTDMFDAIVASNGGRYVDRDAKTGKFINASGRPEFIESLQFVIRMYREGVMKERPETSNWDWYKAEFRDGKVAMRVDESYVMSELQGMKDDWGMVLFPKGPKAGGTYRVFTRDNIMVIPSTFNLETVEKILFALALWYTPVDDNWQAGLYNTFRDRRAVDETIAMIRDPKLHLTKYYTYINGLERGDLTWEMWYHEGDPAQLVESVSNKWNAIINDSNF